MCFHFAGGGAKHAEKTFAALIEAMGGTVRGPRGRRPGQSLENPGKIVLELIEVQTGSYFGEDDIIRIEDDYQRS